LVLRAPGTNCDGETSWALEAAGAPTDRVHVNALLRGEVHLKDYGLLVFPGGFSFGDDIASGKVLANRVIYRLQEQLDDFLRLGRPVLGICNGFQVLVKAGLLPGTSDGRSSVPTASLMDNDSGVFECRWIFLKTSADNFWTRGLPEVFPLPVAHGEGKFVSDPVSLRRLDRAGQIVFRYTTSQGKKPRYPDNPNGSEGDIAAVTNPAGNVLGLMPHPERNSFPNQTPFSKTHALQSVGLKIFKNAVRYAAQVN